MKAFAFFFLTLGLSTSAMAVTYSCDVSAIDSQMGQKQLGRISFNTERPSNGVVTLNQNGDTLNCGSFVDDTFRAAACMFEPVGTKATLVRGAAGNRPRLMLRNSSTGKLSNGSYTLVDDAVRYMELAVAVYRNQEGVLYYTKCIGR